MDIITPAKYIFVLVLLFIVVYAIARLVSAGIYNSRLFYEQQKKQSTKKGGVEDGKEEEEK